MASSRLEAFLGFFRGVGQEQPFDQKRFFADLLTKGQSEFFESDLMRYQQLCLNLFLVANGGRDLMALSVYCGNPQNEKVVRTFVEAVIPGVPAPHINKLFESFEFWKAVRAGRSANVSYGVHGLYPVKLPNIGAIVILANQSGRRDFELMRDIYLGQKGALEGIIRLGSSPFFPLVDRMVRNSSFGNKDP